LGLDQLSSPGEAAYDALTAEKKEHIMQSSIESLSHDELQLAWLGWA